MFTLDEDTRPVVLHFLRNIPSWSACVTPRGDIAVDAFTLTAGESLPTDDDASNCVYMKATGKSGLADIVKDPHCVGLSASGGQVNLHMASGKIENPSRGGVGGFTTPDEFESVWSLDFASATTADVAAIRVAENCTGSDGLDNIFFALGSEVSVYASNEFLAVKSSLTATYNGDECSVGVPTFLVAAARMFGGVLSVGAGGGARVTCRGLTMTAGYKMPGSMHPVMRIADAIASASDGGWAAEEYPRFEVATKSLLQAARSLSPRKDQEVGFSASGFMFCGEAAVELVDVGIAMDAALSVRPAAFAPLVKALSAMRTTPAVFVDSVPLGAKRAIRFTAAGGVVLGAIATQTTVPDRKGQPAAGEWVAEPWVAVTAKRRAILKSVMSQHGPIVFSSGGVDGFGARVQWTDAAELAEGLRVSTACALPQLLACDRYRVRRGDSQVFVDFARGAQIEAVEGDGPTGFDLVDVKPGAPVTVLDSADGDNAAAFELAVKSTDRSKTAPDLLKGVHVEVGYVTDQWSPVAGADLVAATDRHRIAGGLTTLAERGPSFTVAGGSAGVIAAASAWRIESDGQATKTHIPDAGAVVVERTVEGRGDHYPKILGLLAFTHSSGGSFHMSVTREEWLDAVSRAGFRMMIHASGFVWDHGGKTDPARVLPGAVLHVPEDTVDARTACVQTSFARDVEGVFAGGAAMVSFHSSPRAYSGVMTFERGPLFAAIMCVSSERPPDAPVPEGASPQAVEFAPRRRFELLSESCKVVV